MATSLLVVTTPLQQVYTHWRDKVSGLWAKPAPGPLAMEAWNGAHWVQYAVNAPEETNGGSGGGYVVTPPATLAASWYDAVHHLCAISPAVPAPGDIVVGTDDVQWDGSAIVIPGTVGPPTLPNICVLWDYEQDERGFVEGSGVNLTLAVPPQVTATGILESVAQSTESRWDGYWEIPMVQGKQYILDIPRAGVISKIITAPSQARIQARTFLP